MRLSSLSAAVAVAFLGLNSAYAAQPVAAPSTVTAQAQRLGFDQVSFGPDGRQNTMIMNVAGTRSAAGLRAANVDEAIALFQGELGALAGLKAGGNVVLDQFNTMPEGSRYYRMTQTYQGVPVFGDNITVQTDAAGTVQAVFGAAIAIDSLDTTPRNTGNDAIRAATNAALQADGNFFSGRQQLVMEVQPHLVIYAFDGHAPTLAWEATVRVHGGSEPFRSRVFADASSGALLNNVTLITHAINRKIYDVANGSGLKTAAALRAMEIGAQVIMKGTKVDGIYDSDPLTNANAKKYADIPFMTILNQNLKVMDSTAVSLCMDNKLPLIVFNLKEKGNFERVVRGEPIGTLVTMERR